MHQTQACQKKRSREWVLPLSVGRAQKGGRWLPGHLLGPQEGSAKQEVQLCSQSPSMRLPRESASREVPRTPSASAAAQPKPAVGGSAEPNCSLLCLGMSQGPEGSCGLRLTGLTTSSVFLVCVLFAYVSFIESGCPGKVRQQPTKPHTGGAWLLSDLSNVMDTQRRETRG